MQTEQASTDDLGLLRDLDMVRNLAVDAHL